MWWPTPIGTVSCLGSATVESDPFSGVVAHVEEVSSASRKSLAFKIEQA